MRLWGITASVASQPFRALKAHSSTRDPAPKTTAAGLQGAQKGPVSTLFSLISLFAHCAGKGVVGLFRAIRGTVQAGYSPPVCCIINW
jgi:hypothetical protein